jgi:hypothetical protein
MKQLGGFVVVVLLSFPTALEIVMIFKYIFVNKKRKEKKKKLKIKSCFIDT